MYAGITADFDSFEPDTVGVAGNVGGNVSYNNCCAAVVYIWEIKYFTRNKNVCFEKVDIYCNRVSHSRYNLRESLF